MIQTNEELIALLDAEIHRTKRLMNDQYLHGGTSLGYIVREYRTKLKALRHQIDMALRDGIGSYRELENDHFVKHGLDNLGFT